MGRQVDRGIERGSRLTIEVPIRNPYLRALDLFDDLEAPEKNRKRWNRELRTEVAHLAIEAFRRGEISRGRLLEVGRSIDFKGDRLLVLAEAACR